MRAEFATRGVWVAFVMYLLVTSNTALSAENSGDPDFTHFNAEQYFDFSSPKQLEELPTFGEDHSYLADGKLMCPITAGTHKGLGRKYVLEKDGFFTDEVELSFDIVLDANFQTNTHPHEIGKFPGLEGIYDLSAGWGGKPVGVQNSWSIRIGHQQQNSDGKVPVGLYIYHPNMTYQYGTGVSANFALEPMKTYRIKLYVKLNDVGSSNGVIKLFVDGLQTYSSDSWTLRLSESVHIKSVWLDAYIGGITPSPVDTWVSLDNLQVKWNKCDQTGCAPAENKQPPTAPQNFRVELVD